MTGGIITSVKLGCDNAVVCYYKGTSVFSSSDNVNTINLFLATSITVFTYFVMIFLICIFTDRVHKDRSVFHCIQYVLKVAIQVAFTYLLKWTWSNIINNQ